MENDIYGTNGADSLIGTSGRDDIKGRGGDDVLQGLGGNDDLYGGSGNDILFGGAGGGRDLLIGANACMIRRGLAPAAAAHWARGVGSGTIPPPAPIGRVPAEIVDLVDATQRSLDRLNAALAAERRRAAEAAHALRTPVAVLLARLYALPPGETTDRRRADLAALSRIVRQVLASARVDSLAVSDSAVADLGLVAETVTAALAPLAYSQGVELSLDLAPDPALARADPEGVEVALDTLVENAILHAGVGPVEVTVGPGPELRVRDHGPGPPPGARTQFFKPFWRGETAAPGGAGLGLAIVERLQRAQGGWVEARAPVRGGAEFVPSFRLARCPDPVRLRSGAGIISRPSDRQAIHDAGGAHE